jgi:transcriptional regulator
LYIPKHFAITDSEKINSFLRQHSFGELISTVDGRLFTTHLPFLFDEDSKTLRMHVAKANPQWQHLGKEEVLLVVAGPHGYVSPSWYHSPGVPTWNYQAVHVYGVAKAITDSEELKSIVDGLTKIEEAKYPAPWQADYAATMLQGIVGVELAIAEIQCKFKLSQNRSKADQLSAVEALSKENSGALADAMASENR